MTSTITKTQTVTSRTSQSRSSVTFASEVDKMPGAGGEEQNSETDTSELRSVVFVPPNQFLWGPNRSVSFLCCRRWLTNDGISFQERGGRKRECHIVHMRLHPFSEGGTRLVYCFKDTTVPLLHKEARTDARIVAKLSRYTDDWHNSREVVFAYAKSTAVAKFYSGMFMLAAARGIDREKHALAKILSLDCYMCLGMSWRLGASHPPHVSLFLL